ncbi:hypothetical protein [Falsiroseomonas tokyonensis]|uniref:Uncharacterized protein n=1 Tax=Falsiroseomonas tokyonensis TaxID=430521 RepID=A0ABV7C2E3_9PROT|nr:hypothetical protein [Falsiroseomonas tokyonensis]MBU8541078.1 hypothetical protein [Falsiroseomonas tokyonensis]
MRAAAILLLLLTLAAGAAAGLLYLQRIRRPWLTRAHLILALAGSALVLVLVVTAPRGASPPDALPPLLLGLALAAGWGAPRLLGRGHAGARLGLAAHVLLGLAGFLVLLAWARGA